MNEVVPLGIAGKPQPLTPPKIWIALAGELHGSSTVLGIVGGTVPCVECNKMALRECSPEGRVKLNGTPCTVFGDQSSKTIFSSLFKSLNMPCVLSTVATLSSGTGRYLPRSARNASRFTNSSEETCFSKPSGMSD